MPPERHKSRFLTLCYATFPAPRKRDLATGRISRLSASAPENHRQFNSFPRVRRLFCRIRARRVGRLCITGCASPTSGASTSCTCCGRCNVRIATLPAPASDSFKQARAMPLAGDGLLHILLARRARARGRAAASLSTACVIGTLTDDREFFDVRNSPALGRPANFVRRLRPEPSGIRGRLLLRRWRRLHRAGRRRLEPTFDQNIARCLPGLARTGRAWPVRWCRRRMRLLCLRWRRWRLGGRGLPCGCALRWRHRRGTGCALRRHLCARLAWPHRRRKALLKALSRCRRWRRWRLGRRSLIRTHTVIGPGLE